MIAFLAKNPLLLLFLTAALGYAIGRIRIKGASLGVAAVLFVGLFIGSFSPDLKIPDFAFTFGLAVFVYTIGLSSGAGFFASFTRKGLRDNLFVLTMLLIAFGLVLLSAGWFALKPTVAAGVFAGSLTNTPALGGVLDVIRNAAGANVEALLAEPVVGYSVTYPMGVLGPIFAILVMSRIFRIDYRKEAAKLKAFNLVEQEIYNVTVRVKAGNATNSTLAEFSAHQNPNVVFGRIEHNGVISLADGETRLAVGDLVSIVGGPEDVDAAAAFLGTVVDEHLDFDRSNYDFRRIFVSHNDVVGRRIGDLKLPEKYDAIITRVRRGDVDFLANAGTVLELGDRVRVVAARGHMKEVTEFFGDSYKELSEVDLLSFGLGMVLGLLVGQIPIPLPGGRNDYARLGGRPAAGGAGAGRAAPHGPHCVDDALQRQPYAAPAWPDSAPGGRGAQVRLYLRLHLCAERRRDHLPGGRDDQHGNSVAGALCGLQAAQDSLWHVDRDGGLHAYAAGGAGLCQRAIGRRSAEHWLVAGLPAGHHQQDYPGAVGAEHFEPRDIGFVAAASAAVLEDGTRSPLSASEAAATRALVSAAGVGGLKAPATDSVLLPGAARSPPAAADECFRNKAVRAAGAAEG